MQYFNSVNYISDQFDSTQTSSYELAICIQNQKILYTIATKERVPLVIKELPNVQNLGLSIFIRYIFETETLLKLPYQGYTLFTTQPTFTLIPQRYTQPEGLLKMARILLEDAIYAEDVAQVPIHSTQATLIFTFSKFIEEICAEYLPTYQLNHIVALDIEVTRKLIQKKTDGILLHIFDGYLIAIVYKNSRLQLCNSFEYKTVMDALYFIQSVCKATQLPIVHTPIYMIGEFERDSKLYQELKAYLPHLQILTDCFPANLLRPQTTQPEQESAAELAIWKVASLGGMYP